MTEVKCIYGQSTEKPCPRPGTVAQPGRLPEQDRVCEVHAALTPLADVADNLAFALEKLDELEEWARENNNGPMFGLVGRARDEFTERLELLDKHTRAISLAGS
jgi:hypothetical protein